MSLSVGSWHCAARAHRVELADDAITVTINPTCCDAAALSMSKNFLHKAIIIAASFPRQLSMKYAEMSSLIHLSANSIIQSLEDWQDGARKKNNFKVVVYPGRFYSLISYSKAEKFNITSFFCSTEQWIRTSHLIPLMIEPVLDTIPYQNPLWPGQKSV